jgi:hypothetical protein
MTTPAAAILGIDLGTTEVKVGLVGLDGRLLAIARAGYGLDVGPDGRAEQDPEAWWSAVVVAVHALRPPESVDVVAIGVDGHGPTLVAVDERGLAVRPAITFLDTRSTAEGQELAAATGIRGWALGPLPAALWLERNEPDIAVAARWYLTTWEWLAFRLTGAAAAPSVPGEARPDPAVVAAATGLLVDRLPMTTAMGGLVAPLGADAAVALGLRAGIPVAGGTNDAFASYLGAGLTDAGDAYDPGGSAGGFGVYWDEALDVPGAFVTPAPLPGSTASRCDGGDGTVARLVPGRGRRRFGDDRGAARGGRDDPCRRRWRGLPPVSRGRALADLGPRRHWCVRRVAPWSRSGSSHASDPRSERARDPRCRRTDAGGRRARHGDARVRRTARSETWNQIKATSPGSGCSSRPS